MPEENVKVAVRVRPFNRRERERNAKLIIQMNGATTTITDPTNSSEEPKKFTFDFSYWSHDGCKENGDGYFAPDTSHENGKKFADQQKVFDDLGIGVLTNAWEGYNSTLFAYGQTGSGKSWSMVGYGVNKGIVPLFCDKMFTQVGEKKSAGDKTEFEVSFSMLEIYNEQVRDLLDSRPPAKGGLRVRQHPKQGFYADGLQVVPVNSYNEIENKMAEGTRNRTVASTNMNATSSRAHTIVGITFVQKFVNAAGEETAKTAVINLVDLAGSERADSTGATGDRLKEGAAINQSLSNLGNCIAALADRASGKDTRVPYRNSVLTKLLKNALGGNSKTIMIAALSPADINFDETLSTLRYADRAKQIKTSASVNEDPTEKLIRELQEENEKLKAMIASGKMEIIPGEDDDDDDMTDEERAQIKADLENEYKSILEKNQKEMEEMRKTFEQRLQERGEDAEAVGLAAISEKKKTVPHLSNLNSDEQLSGQIIHFIDGPEKTVGNGKGDPPADIDAHGPSIAERHAVIREEGGKFSVEPCSPETRVLHNGKTIASKTPIAHNDRLIFGTTKYFLFINPKERDSSKIQYPHYTFDLASEEVAKKSGFDVSGSGKSVDDSLLQDDLLDLLPEIQEANDISKDLDKKKKFDLMIVSPDARGELSGRTEAMVKVTDIETKHEWIWPKSKFINRKYKMNEIYLDFQEGDDPWDVEPDKDPFLDDPNSEFPIGSVKVWVQSLAYLIETKEQLDITDYQGKEVGVLNVELLPCDKSGKIYTEKDDIFVEDPRELYGKDVYFEIDIHNARGLPNKFTDVYAKFKIPYTSSEEYCTKKIPNTINPDWNFKQKVVLKQVNDEVLEFLQHSAIMVQIWGKQKPPKQKKTLNTKDALNSAALTKGQVQSANTNVKKVDPDKIKYMMEAAMLRKRQQLMEQKLHSMKKMIETAEQHKKKKISTNLIKDIYHAPTADAADKCIALIPLEKGKI